MLKDNMLRLNMQYFAEEEATEDPIEDSAEEQSEEEPKTFTEDELNEKIEKRLARERSNFKKEQQEAIANAISEGKRLAQLSAEERAKEEAEKAKADLTAREAALQAKELKLDTQERLTAESIPLEFTDFLMGADGESTNENIKTFKALFDKAISEAVELRLKDNVVVPKSSGTMRSTKTDFNVKSFQNENRLIK